MPRIQYTVPQYEAAAKVAEFCDHNKLPTMACIECFAQHLANTGAGAKPDTQFMDEYKKVYEELQKLREAEGLHAAEMVALAEALSEAREAARVEHEYAQGARKHIGTLDVVKGERDKASKRRDEISTKYRAVRDTLKDTLDELKTSQETVLLGEETIGRLEKLGTQLEEENNSMIARLDEVANECAKRDLQILDLTKDRDEWQRVSRALVIQAQAWSGTALLCMGFTVRRDRHDSIRAAIEQMVKAQMLVGLIMPEARKYVATWMRRVRRMAAQGLAKAKEQGWTGPRE